METLDRQCSEKADRPHEGMGGRPPPGPERPERGREPHSPRDQTSPRDRVDGARRRGPSRKGTSTEPPVTGNNSQGGRRRPQEGRPSAYERKASPHTPGIRNREARSSSNNT